MNTQEQLVSKLENAINSALMAEQADLNLLRDVAQNFATVSKEELMLHLTDALYELNKTRGILIQYGQVTVEGAVRVRELEDKLTAEEHLVDDLEAECEELRELVIDQARLVTDVAIATRS